MSKINMPVNHYGNDCCKQYNMVSELQFVALTIKKVPLHRPKLLLRIGLILRVSFAVKLLCMFILYEIMYSPLCICVCGGGEI